MDAERIEAYLQAMGCRKIRKRGQQVYSTCPNEREHSKGKDTRPGFTVKVNPSGKSPSWCPSCKLNDSFEWVVFELTGDRGPLSGVAESNDGLSGIMNARHWGKPMSDKPEELVVYEESLLNPFSVGVPRYALERGITIATCRAWGLGHDKASHRLTFPVRMRDGRLVGLSGRAVMEHPVKYTNYSLDKKFNKFVPFIDYEREKDFVTWKKSHLLFGEHMISSDRGNSLLIVEGEIDAVMSWQNGFNAVAIKGSYVSDEQLRRLGELEKLLREAETFTIEKFVVVLDNDKAGLAGVVRMKEVWPKSMPVEFVTCPEKKDPGAMTREQLLEVLAQSIASSGDKADET